MASAKLPPRAQPWPTCSRATRGGRSPAYTRATDLEDTLTEPVTIPTTAAQTAEAVRLLGVYTAGRFDIWMLAGNHKGTCRAHVMSALMGRKMPQSKSGVTMLRTAFYERVEALTGARPAGDHIAARETSFIAWCRAYSTS